MELQYKAADTWTTCFELGSVAIPSVAYLGFSAETGELSDNFDIISVETKNLYNSVSTDPQKETDGRRKKEGKSRKWSPGKEKKSGGWGWFFFKVIVFFAVCGGGYAGYVGYRTSKRTSRFD